MSNIHISNQQISSCQNKNSLGFILRTGAFYLGPTMNTTVHALHTYKIYIAIDGEFDLLLEGGRSFSSCKAAIIAPDRLHKLFSRGGMVGLFCLVPETEAGRKISAFFSGQDVFAPPPQVLAAIMPHLRMYLEHGCNVEEACDLCGYLFNNLAPCSNAGSVLDFRVRHAIKYLDSMVGCRVTIAKVASEVALSQSYLEHLFSEQVGISISRYVLWARMRDAVTLMVSNQCLTQVAHEVGFSDSAHLSRTFRRMLGIAPSDLLRTTSLYKANSEP
jgi:AraC-like DNA-binding protein